MLNSGGSMAPGYFAVESTGALPHRNADSEVLEMIYSAGMADKPAPVAVLNERVNNHIKFFWTVVAFGFVWLASVTALLQSMRSDLSAIKGQLRIAAATGTLEKAIVADAAKDPAVLRSAGAAIENAKSQSIPLDPNLTLKVAQKAVVVATEGTDPPTQMVAWQTFQQAVNYTSYRTTTGLFSGAGGPIIGRMPDCIRDVGDLLDKPYISDDRKTLTMPLRKVFSGCVLELDRALAPPQQNAVFVLKDPVVFERCIIVYNGGRPILVGTMNFKDCLFMLNFRTVPPPAGQRFAETLVASELTVAEVPPAS